MLINESLNPVVNIYELTIAELVTLHTNLWLSKQSGAQFDSWAENQFMVIEDRLKRVSGIPVKLK